MDLEDVRQRGIVLLGCGKMGSAMLAGWLVGGLPASAVWVVDPYPSSWLNSLDGLHLNSALPPEPAIVVIAVKPQMVDAALPAITMLGGGGTLFISIAAGTPIRQFEQILGPRAPVIRAMPNTPAAVSKGVTALIGNARVGEAEMALAEALLSAVGQTVRLDDESQMDAVTALSGSGPAYVFHLIEAMAAAGVEEGLSPNLSMRLAKATVAGAGHLAEQSVESPTQLRVNVTSPGGTTAAALAILMDERSGMPALMRRAVAAAAARSRDLAG